MGSSRGVPPGSGPGEAPQSCRSEEGITVGLVDALIAIIRVLAPRDLSTENVQEALADLLQDPDFRTVQGARIRTFRNEGGE